VGDWKKTAPVVAPEATGNEDATAIVEEAAEAKPEDEEAAMNA